MRTAHLCSLVVLLAALSQTAAADTVLVSYGFDGKLPTAAEGFYLFENSRGFVEPTDSVKFSGYRSLELQEAPLDGTFVELQGVVPPIESGNVLFHFAMLIRNPEEELNIAVAGPAHFYMQRDGIAFWLKSIDGALFTHTDSLPKRLFRIEKDTWYVVDVVFHIDDGTYDLRILKSGDPQPRVLLKNLPNATHTPGSKLSKISFIGDLEDRSAVHYFVDDVELRALSRNLDLDVPKGGKEGVTSTKPTIAAAPDRQFIEAGTPSSPAKGYFDAYMEVKQVEFAHPECLPATSLRDFGISRQKLGDRASVREEVKRAIHLETAELGSAPAFTSNEAQSVLLWRRGCAALAANDLAGAAHDIGESLTLAPDSPIARAALVVALSTQKKRREADRELLPLYSSWSGDARLAVLVGIVSAVWSNYDDAREALSGVAAQVAESDPPRLIGKLLCGDAYGLEGLRTSFGEDWKNALDDLYISQNYFYSLLFTSRYGDAVSFADKLVSRYATIPAAARAWSEREADALVLAGRSDDARARYDTIVRDCPACDSSREKLAMLGGSRP